MSTDKPQHEQDYETVRRRLSTEDSEAWSSLSRLHTQAAKVPGLVAWREEMLHALSRGLDYTPKPEEAAARLAGVITDAEAAEQRAVDAESERDAARQEVEALRTNVAELDGKWREVMWQALGRDPAKEMGSMLIISREIDTLRERVATLEAEKSKAESYVEKLRLDISGHVGVIHKKLEHVRRLQDSLKTAEARAKELAAQLAKGRGVGVHVRVAPGKTEHKSTAYIRNHWAGLPPYDDVAALCDALGMRSTPTPPTPAQGVDEDVATVHGALDLLEHDDVGQQTEGFAALGRIEARLSAPTPPALVDPMHPTGKCTCAGEGACEWCLRLDLRERLEALVEEVGPMAEALRDIVDTYRHKPDTFTEFRLDVYTFACLGWARRLLAAYDAAKGGAAPSTLDREQMHKVVELAHQHGWNGVSNAKHLATFLADMLEDAAKYRAAVERAKDMDALAQAYWAMGKDDPDNGVEACPWQDADDDEHEAARQIVRYMLVVLGLTLDTPPAAPEVPALKAEPGWTWQGPVDLGPPMKDVMPEPTAPEVVWRLGPHRVVGTPGLERAEQLQGPDGQWTLLDSIAYRVLARALAEAKREVNRVQEDSFETGWDKGFERGAESMRERAARIVSNVKLKNLASVIRALSLEYGGEVAATVDADVAARALTVAVKEAVEHVAREALGALHRGRVKDAIDTLTAVIPKSSVGAAS